jgi:hypothetical protein
MTFFLRPARNRRAIARRQTHPRLEQLEDRQLLSTFAVINTNDSGAGSLRQAILDANADERATQSAETINFSIGTGARTIMLASALPEVVFNGTIDGTTQPGFSGKPIVELAGAGLNLLGNDTIRGFVINSYGPGGFPGTPPDTTPASGYGLWLQSADIVTGCYIGTDMTGETAPGNAGFGILITGRNDVIGGTTKGSGNVISGNSDHGIVMYFNGQTGPVIGNVLVEGNFIGTDATGHIPLPNGNGIDSIHYGGSTIGGTTPGSGNVISASANWGIVAGDADVIQGNLIGTDVSGTKPLGNGFAGISMPGEGGITIGGASTSAGNIISGNAEGMQISNVGPSNSAPNLIENNLIGVAADGQTPLGNSFNGISIGQPEGFNGGSDNQILSDTIAYNGGSGIDIYSGSGNLVSRNSFYFNAGLAINLGDDGITSGGGLPNNLQAYPTLTSITNASGTTTIQGTLHSSPSTSFTIEFYSNSAVDPSGFIEGKTYLGSTAVMTDTNGNASFSFMTPTTTNTVFTATATDPKGNTSEFYQPQVINSVPRVSGIYPASADENASFATITVYGANFNSNTVAYFQNIPLTHTGSSGVFDSNQLVGAVNSSSLTREGIFSITVVNPAPGGGTSNTFPFTVLTTLPDGTRGTPDQRFVAQLYRDLLKREADAGGLARWTAALDQGESTASVVLQIEQTPEYRTDEVQAIYEQYLHRAADSSGLSGFVSMLMHGSTVEHVAAIIAGSTEFFQNQGGSTNDGFLTALYQDALNRLVDGSGLNTWEHALGSGATRAQVAAAILGSPESQQDFVNGLYPQFLERTADPGGLVNWMQLLKGGGRDETVIAGIAGSQEYFNLVSR